MKNAKKKDFVRINSEKFRKSVSISDVEDLDLLSNISMRNDGTSSSGENDYSDFSGRHSACPAPSLRRLQLKTKRRRNAPPAQCSRKL